MEIPGLGPVVADADDEYLSGPLTVPVLGAMGATTCRFLVAGYDEDEAPEDFHAAILRFLALDESVLRTSSMPVFRYYQDVKAEVGADEDLVMISAPDDVWRHVQAGNEVTVQRDGRGDRPVYVSVECECAWEPEHGLQIVFRGGRAISKVGPFDGHLTNAAAYGDDSLADVVYHSS